VWQSTWDCLPACWRVMARRNLVEQRLKDVVVAAVDDGDVDGEMSQAFGGVQAAESTPDDDHTGAMCCRRIAL
jgi:hypothetical protein